VVPCKIRWTIYERFDVGTEIISSSDTTLPRAAEFFAGIGLARIGLEKAGFNVVWSNDISEQKKHVYEQHFAEGESTAFVLRDLKEVEVSEIPLNLDLAWASFPCTDLSVAGTRAGIHRGIASATFWHFIKLLSRLGENKPRVVAIENVTAFATSHSGKDIESAIGSLNGLGYSVDVLSIDAKHFVPQSRPRLFLIAALDPRKNAQGRSDVRPRWLDSVYNNMSLKTHQTHLPGVPSSTGHRFSDVKEEMKEDDPRWWDEHRVRDLVGSLAEIQRQRFDELRMSSEPVYRTAYRRMRDGIPRWELRSDEIAGCLRTARGGSSKQAVVEVSSKAVRARWMTPVEYARLMGAGDYNIHGITERQAYDGFGDAVCVPVVEWLARNYLVHQVAHSRKVVDIASPARVTTSANGRNRSIAHPVAV
jgi:DNA (cytosine-5)-methyltransferase 1